MAKKNRRADGEAVRRARALERKVDMAPPQLSHDEPLWQSTRAGARTGRGFRYQDAVSALIAVDAIASDAAFHIVPEGYEDASVLQGNSYWHVQAKSRHDSTGGYKRHEVAALLREVVGHAVAREASGVAGRTTLVIERDVAGVTPLPILAPSTNDPLRSLVRDAIRETAPASAWSRLDTLIDIRLCEHPAKAGAERLAEIKKMPVSLAELAFARIQDVVGELSDQNYASSSADPARLTVDDVTALIEVVLETADVGLLDAALQHGVMRPIDWSQLDEGVDIYRSGAIPARARFADQLIPRPSLVESVVERLQNDSFVVIAGASGSGKSGLGLLSAMATRHSTRWQEVRGLHAIDSIGRDAVELCVARVRAMRPNSRSIVGVLIDDAGRHDPSAVQRLIDQLTRLRGVVVLATVREEDRFPVPSLAASAAIRPTLDGEFARALWARSRDKGRTHFEGWKEPAQLSGGLLLEYMSLLEDGKLLEQVIKEQILLRERDPSRREELAILELVASANQYGVSVPVDAVAAHLQLDRWSFQAACRRLLDEHLVAELDGELAPLHELRSVAIVRALDPLRVGGAPIDLVRLVQERNLRHYLRRALEDERTRMDILREGISRAEKSESILTLTSVIVAFRYVATLARAREWHAILVDCGIEKNGIANLAFGFARLERSPSVEELLRPEVIRAVDALRAAPQEPDMSAAWDSISGTNYESWLATHLEKEGIADLVAVEFLLGIRGTPCPPFDPGTEQAFVSALKANGEVLPRTRLLQAARMFDPEFAGRLVREFGVVELLAEAKQEIAWTVSLSEKDNVVSANVLFVDERLQPTIQRQVIELCEIALALVPWAERADISAVDLHGEIAMVDATYTVASKSIKREKLPPAPEVAENRSAMRALTSLLVQADSVTQALHSEAIAVDSLRALLPAAARALVRGRKLSMAELQLVTDADIARKSLLRRPLVDISTDSLIDKGSIAQESDVATALDAVMDRGLTNLVDLDIPKRNPLLGAMALGDAIKKIESAIDSGQFEYLDDPPDLVGFLQDLVALRMVAQSIGLPGTPLVAKVRAATSNATDENLLAAASSIVRASEDAILKGVAARIVRALGSGRRLTRVEIGPAGSMSSWPAASILVVVRDTPWHEYLQDLNEIADLLRDRRDVVDRPVWITLEEEGACLRAFTFEVTSRHLLPLAHRDPPTFPVQWAATPISSLWTGSVDAIRHFVGVLTTIAARQTPKMAEEEVRVLEEAHESLTAITAELERLARGNPTCNYLQEILSTVSELHHQSIQDMRVIVDEPLNDDGAWPSGDLIRARSVVSPRTEDLVNPVHPGTIALGMGFTIASIEDDFDNADQRVEELNNIS